MANIPQERVDRELARFKKKDVSSWRAGIADRVAAVQHATSNSVRALNLGLVRSYSNQVAVSDLLHGRSDAADHVRLVVWSSRELARIRPDAKAIVLQDQVILLLSFLLLRGDVTADEAKMLYERTLPLCEKMPEPSHSLFAHTANVLLNGGSEAERLVLWHSHRARKLIDATDVIDFCTPVSFVGAEYANLSSDQKRIVEGYRMRVSPDWAPY